MSKKQNIDAIDDWDYNSTVTYGGKHSRVLASPVAMSVTGGMMKKSLGFSVGGAKDADNFYENLKNDYLPKIDSITYEGVFYDHYFKSQSSDECKNLFCPTYTTAVDKNPFTDKREYWLSVGLDSNIKNINRKKLNIVVVLDISGSMGSPFNQYYYDPKTKRKMQNSDIKTSKMKIANESIVNMIDHLKDDDKLGVVLFDNSAYAAKPLRSIKTTDIKAIKEHILDLKQRGGTNWSEGYRGGIKLFDTIQSDLKDPTIYENRIIFITDAMPNRGELSQDGLFTISKNASQRGIFTTFIGVGVDFNNELVEAISKTKGANYYSIHSSDEFKKRLDKEFDYMVTPLVFDLKLNLLGGAFKIDRVYGSPNSDKATGEVMYVNTLFPTPTNDDGSRGGVVLLKVKKIAPSSDLNLIVSYKDRSGKSYQSSKKVTFVKDGYEDRSIQKAITLSRYVDLMKNYLLDMRRGCNDKVQSPYPTIRQKCMLYPPSRPEFAYIKTWESRSCPFIVSSGYKKILGEFRGYFNSQIREIDDDELKKELDAIDLILSKTSQIKGTKIDDWKNFR
jgi:Ca-activated chloride channel family protein